MVRLFGFRGGLHLDDRKDLSTTRPIAQAAIPPELVLPLSQHAGAPAKPVVEVGQRVLRGQTIARPDGFVSVPVHASSSGTVSAIEARPVPHASGLSAPCIVIRTDGRDEPLAKAEWEAVHDFRKRDPQALRDIIRNAGIAGLGGAGFPSFIKLAPGRPVDTLIVNGAECEPYITCDQQLMTERADEIVRGIEVMMHALHVRHCLIGIEDNKPTAIIALKNATSATPRIEVRAVPTRYPQGGEKQLIQSLTGLEVPSQGLPLDIGIVVNNPGTVHAIWRAVAHAEPLISRVVTVTGRAVAEPRNFEARLGTPMAFLIEQAGGYVAEPGRLLMGGPMMGFALPSDSLPVVKATNCILAAAPGELSPPDTVMPCIRCGACQEVCPVNLLPQQLYWHARGREYDKARALNLFDCIDCGCCAQVCPSHIPLVQYYRHAKTELWAADRQKRKADAARERHEAHQARIEREEREKAEARARKKAQLAASRAAAPTPAPASPAGEPAAADDPVARAIAAAKARKAGAAGTDDDPVARAIAAAKARKAAPQSEGGTDQVTPGRHSGGRGHPEAQVGGVNDSRNPEIPASAGMTSELALPKTETETETETETDVDDPVSRAIAAAKAKKAAAQSGGGTDQLALSRHARERGHPEDQGRGVDDSRNPGISASEGMTNKSASPEINTGGDDPVSRAIAAAKAKKARASAGNEDDPVARAIAAAKAKKAARETSGNTDDGAGT